MLWPSSQPLVKLNRPQASGYLLDGLRETFGTSVKSFDGNFLKPQQHLCTHPFTKNLQIRLQSLLYLSNVIKRNWNNKRLLKSEKELPQLKKFISAHLIAILEQGEKVFQKSLFDLIGFIAKFDYPHAFGELTSYTLTRLANIKADEENVRIFKALREVFL